MSLHTHNENIKEARKEKKFAKKEFGKHSVEFAEAREALNALKDSRDFYLLHEAKP